MSGYFDDMKEVTGSHMENVPIVPTDDAGMGNGVFDAVMMQLSHVHIGVIAAMCIIMLLLLCCCVCRVKKRRKDADAGGRDEEKSLIPMKGGKSGKFNPSATTTGSGRGRSKDFFLIAMTWTTLDGMETSLQEVVTAALSSLSLLLLHPPNGAWGRYSGT
jgi:hypothetical protein